jgi:DNA polymerase III epsilon subunit-like protein
VIALVFDTETTGAVSKPDWRDPAIDHVMQLYAGLYDFDPTKSYIHEVDGKNVCTIKPFASISVIVETERDPHPKAVEVHGISKARASLVGVDPKNAAHLFDDFVFVADIMVAHNIRFDLGIMARALHTAGIDPQPMLDKPRFCTMTALKPVMRMTPKVYGDWKMPKLIEAYNYVFGRDFEGAAHDASADSLAAGDLYFACRSLNIEDKGGK